MMGMMNKLLREATILPQIDLAHWDSLLLDDGRVLRLMPAEELRSYHTGQVLQSWCHQRGRYGLVTKELIDFLRKDILTGDIFTDQGCALEIGSGMGDLAYHLEIRGTDSAMQTTAEMRFYYSAMGQPIIDPPPWVERIDAVSAVKKHKPRIVIASWCTQLYKDGDTENMIGSSVAGIDEEWLIENVDVYCHIGNDGPHADKRINAKKHQVIYAPWLVSRGRDQSLNCIRIWRRHL